MTATTLKAHVHGVNDLRCAHPDCKAAVTRYRKRWAYDRAHTGRRTVDSHKVRTHLASLEATGWSVRAVAESAGLSPSVVSRIRKGQQPTVTRKAAAKILRLSPDQLPDREAPRGFVSRVGTVRRLQALMALGWPPALLAAHVGEQRSWIYNRIGQGGLWVTRDVRNRVAALYEDLAMTPPPQNTMEERRAVARIRGQAAKRGWRPPLDWDDDALDDPYGMPLADAEDDDDDDSSDYDHAVVERYLASGEKPSRNLTHDEGAEIVRRLRLRGHSTTEIERRGFKPERYTTPSTTEGAAS